MVRGLRPARRLAKCTDQRRQARDIARRHAAAAYALHPVIRANQRRPRGAVQVSEGFDFSRSDAANRRDARRVVGTSPLAQAFESQRVPLDIIAIDQAITNQYMHEPERQSRIRSGQQSDVCVAFFRCQGTVRIDRDQGRTAALGLLRTRPKMHARRDGIRAPEDDQSRCIGQFHVDADTAAESDFMARGTRGGADGAIQKAGAQFMEEAHGHRFALHQSHGSRIAIGENLFGFARRHRLKTACDGGDRLLPADPFEPPLPLLTDAPHRMQQTIGVIGALGVAGHLGTEHARGRCVLA
jgi:hypothetical protein